MDRPLRIIVADDERQAREFYQQIIPEIGHQVVHAAVSGSDLIEQCQKLKPDLVITDIKMPDIDGLDASAQVYDHSPVPIILVSGYHDADLVTRAQEQHILAYLVKPISKADMEVAISMAIRRFQEFEELRQEASTLRQALQDRKIIEKAKSILMRLGDLHEHDAFRRLQKLASRQNKKLVQVAEMIVTAEVAFDPAERPGT